MKIKLRLGDADKRKIQQIKLARTEFDYRRVLNPTNVRFEWLYEVFQSFH